MTRLALLLLLLLALHIQAVEVPTTVVRVVDGDTVETSAGTVRLLWIDTPESRSNAHGPAMPEGKAATEFLANLLAKDVQVLLWGPGETLGQDRYKRLLAVVHLKEHAPGTSVITLTNVNLAIIRAGWSVYWRKYGEASSAGDHKAYTEAQEKAHEAKAGAWATIAQWMTDKANETTAPKPKVEK